MNRDDEYQAWLSTRRDKTPPPKLTDQIMAAVRGSTSQSAMQSEPARKKALQRIMPSVVCAAAALVLAVRLYSVVSIFVVMPSGTEIAMNESVEESSDVNKP